MFDRLFINKWPRVFGGVFLCVLLAACGGGGGGGENDQTSSSSSAAVTSSSSSSMSDGNTSSSSSFSQSSNASSSSQSDGSAPAVDVAFPPAQSMTTNAVLTVRGTAQDLSGVARIRVNGIDAETIDEFANWEASIELQPGENQIVVEAIDSNANAGSTTNPIEIRYLPMLIGSANKSAIDDEAQIIYASSSNQIVAIDIATGLVGAVFNMVHPEPNFSYSQITDVVFDGVNKRLFVSFLDSGAIVAVDVSGGPNQGAQTIVTSNSVPNSTNSIGKVIALAIDLNRNRLLVADIDLNQLVAVNLNTGESFGERSIVSSSTIPSNSSPLILSPRAIIVDPTTDLAYLIQQSTNYILEIKLGENEGARSLLASDDYPFDNIGFDEVKDVAIDLARKKLLVANGRDAMGFISYDRIGVIEVDIASGASKGTKSVLTDEYHPTSRYSFINPSSIVMDEKNSRAIVSDTGVNSFFSVNLDDEVHRGELSALVHSNTPSPDFALAKIRHVSVDYTNDKILVVNGTPSAIYEINKKNGARSLISNNNLAGDTVWPWAPGPLVTDSVNNRIFITDIYNNFFATPEIIAIDSTTGAGTLVSTNSVPNNLFPLENIKDIILDSTRNRLIVLDDETKKIVAVDLNEGPDFGSRSLITDWSSSGDEVDMLTVRSMVLDGEMERLYVAGSGPGKLFEVNLESGMNYGKRTVLSSEIGSGSTDMNPMSIAIDRIGKRLFVYNGAFAGFQRGIYSVDISDSPARGSLELVFGMNDVDTNYFSTIDFLAWDKTSELLYGAKSMDRSVYALDLKTDGWVYLAR